MRISEARKIEFKIKLRDGRVNYQYSTMQTNKYQWHVNLFSSYIVKNTKTLSNYFFSISFHQE